MHLRERNLSNATNDREGKPTGHFHLSRRLVTLRKQAETTPRGTVHLSCLAVAVASKTHHHSPEVAGASRALPPCAFPSCPSLEFPRRTTSRTPSARSDTVPSTPYQHRVLDLHGRSLPPSFPRCPPRPTLVSSPGSSLPFP